jgi:hypothetical protein
MFRKRALAVRRVVVAIVTCTRPYVSEVSTRV